MANTGTHYRLFDISIRVVEVLLIFATVYFMQRGYSLQSKTIALQMRPYVYLSPSNEGFMTIGKDVVEYTLKIKNLSAFPANKIHSYGLVVVDGEPIHGIRCDLPPKSKEARELFEITHNCDTNQPPIELNQNNFNVCVLNNYDTSPLPPNSEIKLIFSFKRAFFDKLLETKSAAKSGISFVTKYEDIDGVNSFTSRFGMLPYKINDSLYDHKTF